MPPPPVSPVSESSISVKLQKHQQQKKRKSVNADVVEIEVDLSLPQPPSKRAKRALKKGKPLPAKSKLDEEEVGDDLPLPSVPQSVTIKGSKKSGKKDVSEGEERKPVFGIWIGNLPFDTTRRALFQWFVDQSGGAIAETDITRINLPLAKRSSQQLRLLRPHNTSDDGKNEPTTPLNKGFAYVDFSTYEAQVAATALSETELNSRRVLIKDSTSFEGRPSKDQQPLPPPNGALSARWVGGSKAEAARSTVAEGMGSTKIFIGNLGFATTEEDLRRHFAPCGPIAWAKVATFPDNLEKCRGYGWVQFGGKTEDGQLVNREEASRAAAAAVLGHVRITETVDSDEVFAVEAEAIAAMAFDRGQGSGAEAVTEEARKKVKAAPVIAPRTKQRKWWLNMLKGRPLKIQFAEDDAVRYKKRFKGHKSQDAKVVVDGGNEESRSPPSDKSAEDRFKHQKLEIASRTGAITASLGKRIILD